MNKLLMINAMGQCGILIAALTGYVAAAVVGAALLLSTIIYYVALEPRETL